jgi:predicted nuclease of restriction endonuclease-like (RecB) superfamily
VKKKPHQKAIVQTPSAEYGGLIGGIAELLETARRTAARTVNALMTATYWEIGRRIVEFEQSGEKRAAYGEELLRKLSVDLVSRFGRGFSRQNLQRFRQFYLSQPAEKICSTLSSELPGKIRATLPLDSGDAGIEQAVSPKSDPPLICSTPSSISETPSRIFQTPSGKSSTPPFALIDLARVFPLPWSHYVLLISRSRSPAAFNFYHTEALRGGWSVRQLDRQIASQFYERTALSRNKNAMLRKGAVASAGDSISADEEVRDPLVLEFLGLKDEYSETDLEEALLRHLESFLLELGGDFAFIGRQRRLRIGGEWYRIDLLFFHRKLRCLVVIDLKVGKFTHADAGQMHLYLNYAREHWTRTAENPPVGLILCAEKDDAIARYALEGLPNKVLAREYRLALPDEKRLAAEIEKTRDLLERRTRSARVSTKSR